jgi:enoyl-[acyl-carrier protein] reductase I
VTTTVQPRRASALASGEIGHAALLLASDHASAITGEILHVDAGFHVGGMVFHG